MSQVEFITKKEKMKHLSLSEREIIKKKLRKGANVKEIAKSLERAINTIKLEIKRGTTIEYKENPYKSKDPNYPTSILVKVYYAEKGQEVYENNRKRCGCKGKQKKCEDLVDYVEKRVKGEGKKKLSPDAAIGYARVNNLFPGQCISTKTFYSWIYKEVVNVNMFDLLRKVSMKPRNRVNIPREHKKKLGKSIDLRPSIVETREEFGHWEGDFIVGKNKGSYLFVLVERKLRLCFIFKIPNRECIHVVKIIDMLEAKYGEHFKSIFKTITFDNGQEFSNSIDIEKDGRLQVYYAHPYSSYERGSNENLNGIVRRLYPKGSCFKNLTEEDIEDTVNFINSMPRKILGYSSSLELWEKEINAIMLA